MTARSLKNLRDTTAGVYILVRKLYLSPPPFENDIFPPLATCYFLTPVVPPFALILPYFSLILPFYFFFLFILLSFFFFLPLSSFLSCIFPLFLMHFPPFFLPHFIFFPPNDIGWYIPPREEGGICQCIDPCTTGQSEQDTTVTWQHIPTQDPRPSALAQQGSQPVPEMDGRAAQGARKEAAAAAFSPRGRRLGFESAGWAAGGSSSRLSL